MKEQDTNTNETENEPEVQEVAIQLRTEGQLMMPSMTSFESTQTDLGGVTDALSSIVRARNLNPLARFRILRKCLKSIEPTIQIITKMAGDRAVKREKMKDKMNDMKDKMIEVRMKIESEKMMINTFNEHYRDLCREAYEIESRISEYEKSPFPAKYKENMYEEWWADLSTRVERVRDDIIAGEKSLAELVRQKSSES
jgi:predicted  nucleic acid-binding Zn-ribbon protein